MKKIFLISALYALSTFSQPALAADEKPSHAEHADAAFVTGVLDHVLLSSTQNAKQHAQKLRDELAADLAANSDKATPLTAAEKTSFSQLLQAFKRIEASYIAGESDPALLDGIRLMDSFHASNEPLEKQLARIVKSNDAPKVALFKNSFKSINALEFYLFHSTDLTSNSKQYAVYTLDNLINRLDKIFNAYQAQQNDLKQAADNTMAYLLNALIDSAYKLKEWRVGEPAGLTKKYQDKPDNSRQEYALSTHSFIAVMAILQLHDDLMGERDYPNIGSMAIRLGAENAVKEIRGLIKQAMQACMPLIAAGYVDFTAAPYRTEIKTLYQTLNTLSNAYYKNLLKSLSVQAKILDADGD